MIPTDPRYRLHNQASPPTPSVQRRGVFMDTFRGGSILDADHPQPGGQPAVHGSNNNRAAALDNAPTTGNPCRFIKRYPSRSRERFLSEQEFERLGAVLDELASAGRTWASACTALRLLMLTGCRRNEILTLRWEDVDLEHDELRLRQAKTGARAVPLSPAAREILAALPRTPRNPWVIPGRVRGTRLCTLNASWQVVREKAELERRANPRPPSLLRLTGSRPGLRSNDDRQASRPPQAPDHRALCAPRTTLGKDRRRQDRGQSCR